MKNLKIIIALIFLFTLNDMQAQSNTQYNLLQNKSWIYKDKEIVTQVYTATKAQTYFNNILQIEEPYYLSEIKILEGNFDPAKVGISVTGKYIVTPNGCYEIITITDKSLVLKNIKHTHNVSLFVN